MKHISILGAGISGLSSAITLARAGYPVTVYEKRKDCGARFRGDFQGLENWSSPQDVLEELRKMNIETRFSYTPFKKMHLTNGVDNLSVVSSKPIFYIIKRGVTQDTLDQSLRNQALNEGVEIQFSAKQKHHQYDIIATGPTPHKITAVAKGITFETSSEDLAVALVNKHTSYQGYSYALIHGGYGCINTVNAYGCGSGDTYLKNTVKMLISLYNIDITNKQTCGGVGSFLLKPRLCDSTSLLVGEAAGLQDFLWGFGMRYAFTSGYLAAQSIITNQDYKTLVRQRLGGTLKASIVNRFYVERLEDYGKILINYGKSIPEGNHISLLNKAYNLTLYKRVLYPIAYLYLWKKYHKLV